MFKLTNSILQTIGNTPMVSLNHFSEELNLNVYAKLEGCNPGGSIKDRTALAMVQQAISDGLITKDTTIVESSSGNMAVGLAQICCYYKLRLIIVTDSKANPHTLQILKAYGVEVEVISEPSEEGGLLGARLQRVEKILKENPNSFSPNQYGNPVNPGTHFQTMKEIHTQIKDIDYVFVATSTCGTLMGLAAYITKNQLSTKLIAVDALGSVIFGHEPQKRLIPGHGSGLPSQFLDEDLVYKVVTVSDQDCVRGCHHLLKEEGILAGGSSGAVVSVARKIAPDIPKNSNCVMIFPDRGERYLDTVYNDDWVSNNFEIKNSAK